MQARREEQILDVATRIFAEHGFADADVQHIADALQIGKGTVYRYFPSKSELFLAAVDRGLRCLTQRIDAETAGVPDPLDRIVQAVYTYLAFFDEHADLIELFIQERAHFRDRARPAYFMHSQANIGPWQDLLRKLAQEGRVRDSAAVTDLQPANDLLFGTILSNRIAGRKIDHREQARSIIELVFLGILTEPERRKRGRKVL